MAYRSTAGAGRGLDLDLGGPHLGRGGVGSRGVALASTRFIREPSSFLSLWRVHWQVRTRGSTAQATHQGAQMVCLGGLIGLPLRFLEDLLGKMAAKEDILLPLDGGP